MVTMLFAGCAQTATESPSESQSQSSASDSSSTETDSASSSAGEDSDGIKIGISINDLQLERWQRDWKYMEAACKEQGVEYVSASADGNEQTQMTQIESMLSQGVDVLIVLPVNQDTLSQAVDLAHESGVKVIAYDRLISNADLDYYVIR